MANEGRAQNLRRIVARRSGQCEFRRTQRGADFVPVLDEADHMADLGFLPGVTRILAATPQGGQRMLFVFGELVGGATVTVDELVAHARDHIHERAAVPKHIEILSELPKTAVGKIFKPDLRKMAIRRVYDEALAGAGLAAEVGEVVDDKKRGLVARLVRKGPVDEAAVAACLGRFTRPWEWA